jgi:hypothetical protein
MIGTRSADYIRASGHGAAQTGRTHDLHPTASRKPKESLDPWAPSTHDPERTLPQSLQSPTDAQLTYFVKHLDMHFCTQAFLLFPPVFWQAFLQ